MIRLRRAPELVAFCRAWEGITDPTEKSRFWVLDEQNQPQPAGDVIEWSLWMEREGAHRGRARVVHTYLPTPCGTLEVSSAFIGLAMGGELPPLLFETIVFTLDDEWERVDVPVGPWRSASWEDAREQHWSMLEALMDVYGSAQRLLGPGRTR